MDFLFNLEEFLIGYPLRVQVSIERLEDGQGEWDVGRVSLIVF
jgi:hypothetical protein